MTAPFLILHKVRGEPAFDIAIKHLVGGPEIEEWWIIPTSGHRAYPWRSFPLTSLEGDVGQGFFEAITWEMPPTLPDHYPASSVGIPDDGKGTDLLRSLGLLKPVEPISCLSHTSLLIRKI